MGDKIKAVKKIPAIIDSVTENNKISVDDHNMISKIISANKMLKDRFNRIPKDYNLTEEQKTTLLEILNAINSQHSQHNPSSCILF